MEFSSSPWVFKVSQQEILLTAPGIFFCFLTHISQITNQVSHPSHKREASGSLAGAIG